VLFFQWRQSQAGAEKFHSAVVPHEGSEHTRIFQQAAQVGADLRTLAPTVADSRITAEVALVMDWQNWWDVEYLPGPSNRLHYWEQLLTYYRAFHKFNIAVDVVAPDSDFSKYRLVVAPLLHMLRPGVAKNFEGFVERGGTFLTTFFSGIVDENGHVGLGGYPAALRKLLGIHIEEFDPLTPEMNNQLLVREGELRGAYSATVWGELIRAEGAQVLGTFAHDYYANQPALTVNHFGQGHAYYLATQSNNELLDALTRQLCKEANVQPVLAAPTGVEVTKRVRSDGKAVYFLLNHSVQAQQVTLPQGNFTSLLDGKSVAGQVDIAGVDAVVLLEQEA